MKLTELMIADESHTVIDGVGGEVVGLLLAVERKLAAIADPAISWRTETAETGFLRAFSGKRRDALVIRHSAIREYTVVVCSRSHGKVLHVSWMVLVTPRLVKDLRRAVRLGTEGVARFEIGAELDVFDVMDLKAFLGITRLALRNAVRELTSDENALLQDPAGAE